MSVCMYVFAYIPDCHSGSSISKPRGCTHQPKRGGKRGGVTPGTCDISLQAGSDRLYITLEYSFPEIVDRCNLCSCHVCPILPLCIKDRRGGCSGRGDERRFDEFQDQNASKLMRQNAFGKMHLVVRHRRGWKNNYPEGKNCIKIINLGQWGMISGLEGQFLTIFRDVNGNVHLELAKCLL